jgi:quercetin dioxygenase-like cupin family protein
MTFDFLRSRLGQSPSLSVAAIGVELAVRLPPAASGGEMTVIETLNAPGFGPPLHRHREAEMFRVLEGRYLFQVDGRRFEAVADDLVSVPGGASHAFVNIDSRPSRQLAMILPEIDAAAFFGELARVMAQGRPDPAGLAAFGRKWGVEFLGPPLPPRGRTPGSAG